MKVDTFYVTAVLSVIIILDQLILIIIHTLDISGFQVGIPHMTSADTTLKGIGSIPKGTQTFHFSYPSNNDPKQFPDPEEFNPDRFYIDGAFVNPTSDRRSMFGLGRRRCPGEILARSEIFLFTTRLVQCYRLGCDSAEAENLEKGSVPGAPGTPYPFKFRLQER